MSSFMGAAPVATIAATRPVGVKSGISTSIVLQIIIALFIFVIVIVLIAVAVQRSNTPALLGMHIGGIGGGTRGHASPFDNAIMETNGKFLLITPHVQLPISILKDRQE